MMSCGICSKWQHIYCHDAADQRTGRPKRNWDIEEFVCQRCRSQATRPHDGPRLQPSKLYSDHSSARTLTQLPPSTNRIAYIPTTPATVPRAAPIYTGTQSYGMSIPDGYHTQDNLRTTTHAPQQQPYQPQPPSSITFAHYQPDPQGFSTRQTYHRDIPSQSQGYPQQQLARPLSQPRLSAATTTLQPLQVCHFVTGNTRPFNLTFSGSLPRTPLRVGTPGNSLTSLNTTTALVSPRGSLFCQSNGNHPLNGRYHEIHEFSPPKVIMLITSIIQ